MDAGTGEKGHTAVANTVPAGEIKHSPTDSTVPIHGPPEVVETYNREGANREEVTVDEIDESKKGWFAYFKTKDSYVVLLLGYKQLCDSMNVNLIADKRNSQVLALCITATNTFSSLLVVQGTSIPAFQTFFNYVLLNLIYTSYTVYRYGFKGYARFLLKDGWKCNLSLFPPNPNQTNPNS